MLVRPNIQYLAFDDRKLLLYGIPLVSLISPLVFFGLSPMEYFEAAHQELPEGLLYTGTFWLCNRYLLIRLRIKYDSLTHLVKRFIMQFVIILISAPIINIIISLFLKGVYILTGTEDICEPTLIQGLAATYFLTFSVLLLYDTIYFFHKYKEALMEKEWIKKAHIQSQLDNLRNQINPHFLFNSMNTLMNLIPEEGDKARNYLGKLSTFYRYAVSKQEEATVPLSMEFENAKIYIELLKERFADSLDISLPDQIPGNCHVLPLALQLLVENAIKHNIVSKNKPLKIDISLSSDGKHLVVRNNLQRKIQPVESTGMGLENIKKRISFFTDELLIVSNKQDTFEVRLPLIDPNQAN
ncbi:MAG: histidine kinase [Saprospiraceae bacterium]|nr:histidine kinase [Saprospiraceae bacterium]